MPMLKIKLFGSPQVMLDEQPVAIPRQKAVALLAYLAGTAQPHTRDALATLLWPEHSQTAARTGLRRMLYLLRQGLGEAWLLTSRREVGLAFGESLWVDVLAFQQSVKVVREHHLPDTPLCADCVRRLTDAVAAYSAPLLEGFTLKDAPQFDEWHYFTAESAEQGLAAALQRLIQHHATQQHFSEAIGYARRWVALDPLHEAAQRELMRLYAAAGQTAAAVRQYQLCAETLARELDVEPEAATQALLAAIEAGKLTPAPETAVSTPAVRAAPKIDWGNIPDVGLFYGRQAEMQQLESWLLDDGCRMVAILGMGGMGKTTLTARLARRLSRSVVEDGKGGNGRLPFQRIIWRSLLNAPPLADLLPEWLQFLSAQQLAQLPTNLDQGLALLLTYLREQRCLLVLDNMESILQGEGQRAGQYRAGYEDYGQLIQQIGQSEHQSCLLLTSREKPQGFRRLEGDFRAVQSLPLQGLSPTVGQAFLEGRGVDGRAELTQTVVERYSGNPLALKLVAETIQDLFGGDLSEFLADEGAIFDDIRVVLEQHFARLSDIERDILLWLMIEREPISAARLRDNLVQPPPRRQFLEALRSLRRRSLLVQSSTGQPAQFALQNVIAEYAIEQFSERVEAELLDESPNWLHRFPILKAQSKDFVRESQRRLIVEPLAKRLLAREGKAGLTARLLRLVEKLREQTPGKPSYAAGSLLNLLLAFDADLAAADFSRLAVWQAELSEAQLTAVHFAQADLTGSLFKEAFLIVTSVAYSPDGQLLAAGSYDGMVRLWRAADFQPAAVFRGHSNSVSAIAFHPDGETLVSASVDQALCIWELATGQKRQTLLGHSDVIMAVAYDPTGRLLASAGHDPAIRIWDLARGECVALLTGHQGSILALRFDPNGRYLYSGGADKSIRVWDLATSQCAAILQAHESRIWSIVVSEDGQTLFSSGDEQSIYVWDVARQAVRQQFSGDKGGARALALSPDGQLLASGGFGKAARLWNVTTGENVRTLANHQNAVASVDFSPDGQRLVCGTPGPSVRVWDVETGQSLKTLKGTIQGVTEVTFSPDGETILSGSNDGQIRLWLIENGRQTKLLVGHWGRIRGLTFSQDGRLAASGSTDKTVRVWDVESGRCLWMSDAHQMSVRTVAFSPNGRWLATAGEGKRIRLWDVPTGRLDHLLSGHASTIISLTFSPDGRHIWSVDSKLGIFIWDAERGNVVEQVREQGEGWAFPIAFRGDQRLLAKCGDDKNIDVLRLPSGEQVATLTGHTDWILSVEWHPDGRHLVSGGVDRTVRLWSVEDERCLHTLVGHRDRVWWVTFSADGRRVVSCSADETIRLWDVASGACLLILAVERPYEGMNIWGATGISEAQKETLFSLGAIEEEGDGSQRALRSH